jgi:hypothetical protein
MKASSYLQAFSCDDCDVVSFDIPNALTPESDVICSHCGAALGTLGSLQDLAERLLQRICSQPAGELRVVTDIRCTA